VGALKAIRNITFEYENPEVAAFLTDEKISMVDNVNRYLVQVLLHANLVTEDFDKALVKKIDSYIGSKDHTFEKLSEDPLDEIITAMDILVIMTNIDKIEEKIEFDSESLV